MASVPTRKKLIDKGNDTLDCQANVMDYPATQAFTCSDDEEQEISDSDEKTVIQIGKIIVDSVSYPIYRGINKVGRLSSCGVVIDDSTVSKEHAEIEADTGSKSTFVCDLGSMNKTRLNNILLRPRKMYQLNYGDTIRFGSVITTYSKISENSDSDPSKQSHQKLDNFVVPETPARLSKDAASTIIIPSSPDISFTSDRSSVDSCSDVSLVMGTQQPVPCSRQSDVVSAEKNSDTRRNLNLGNNSTINGSYDHSILDAEDQKNQSNDEDDIFDAETQRNDVCDAETQQFIAQANDSKTADSHKEKLHRNNVPENPTEQTSIYEAETQQIKINEENVDRSYVDKETMDPANIYEQATQITSIHEVETQPINISEDDVIPLQKNRTAINKMCLESEEKSLVLSPVVVRMRSMSNDSRSNSPPANSTANRDQTSKLESGTKDEDSETDEEGLFAENHSPKNSADQVLQKSTDGMYDAPTQLIRVSSDQGASAQKNLKLNEVTRSDGNALRDGFEKVANDESAREKSSPAFGKQESSFLVDKKVSKRTIINESLDDDETDFEDEDDSLLSVGRATTTPKITSNDEIVKSKKIALNDSSTKCASSDSGTEDATATMKPHDSIEDKMNDLFDEAKNDSFIEEPTQLLTQTLHKVLETTQVVEGDGAASPKIDSNISGDLNRENAVSSPCLAPTNIATASSNGFEEKNKTTTTHTKNLDCASNSKIESSPRKNEFFQAKPLMTSTLLDTEDLFADLPEVTILSAAKKPRSLHPFKKRGKPKDSTTTLTSYKESDCDSENDEDVVKTVTSRRKPVGNKRKTKKPVPVATPKTVPQESNFLQDQGEEIVQKRFSSRISKAKTTSDLPTASSTVPIVPPVVIPADNTQPENIPQSRMSSKKNRKANVPVEKNQATISPLLKMMKVTVSAEKMSAIDDQSKKNRSTTISDVQDSSATIPSERSVSENISPEMISAESVSGEKIKIPVTKTRAKRKQSATISSEQTPDTNTSVKRVSTRSKRLITSYATLNKDQILAETQMAQMRSEQVSPALVAVQRIDNVPSTSETSKKPANTDSESKATGKHKSSVSVAKPAKDSIAVEDVEEKTAIPETIKAPGRHVTIRSTRRKIDKVTVRRSPSSPMVRINYDKPASPVPVATTPETPKSRKTLTIDEPNSSEQKSVKRRTVEGSGTDTVNKVVAKRKKVSESVDALDSSKASNHEGTKTVRTSHASSSSPVAIISLQKVEGSSSLWTTNTKTAKAKAGQKQGRQTLKNSTTEKSDTLTTGEKPQSRSLRSSLLSTTALQQVDGRPSLESQEIETILTNSNSRGDRIAEVNTGNRILSRRIPCRRLDENRDSTDEDEEDDDDVFESNSRPTNKTNNNSDSEKSPSKRRKITRAKPNVIERTTVSLVTSKTPKENDSVVAAKLTKVAQRLSSPARSTTSKNSLKHQVLFTGVNDERLTSAVRDLGGSVTEKTNDCTVLVTDKVRRTFKFLCAMASAVPIVSADWLFDSQKQKHFLPTEQYLLDDPAEEMKYKFNLRESLDSANERRLLEGWTVVLAPNTAPPPLPEMKGIIQACGGKPVVRAPATWPAKVVVVAKEEDSSSWKKIMKTAPVRVPLVSREFILTGILRQELNFDEHRLHVR